MDRRKALKQLSLLSGGLILLPSCDFSKEEITRAMNNLEVTPTQESLLSDLVDFIIPETNIPGGQSLELDKFVWVMVDDCLPKKQQEVFLKGLSTFEKVGFSSIKTETPATGEVLYLIETTKSFATLGFMQSEFVMTELMPYALVPGKPPVCRTIDPNDQININA
jgi:hypothetical protein